MNLFHISHFLGFKLEEVYCYDDIALYVEVLECKSLFVFQDPILKDMETHFSDLSYIKQQVSCLTNPTLPRCEVGQRCENCCCDDVGLKLRGKTHGLQMP